MTTNGRQPEDLGPMEYLGDLFGDRAELLAQGYLRQRQQFAWWLRTLRETTPLERVKPAVVIERAARRRIQYVSRPVFLDGFRKAYEDLSGHGSAHDEKFVKRLEAGRIPLTPLIPACSAFALRADRLRAAILFEAAGYAGMPAVLHQLDEWHGATVAGFRGFIAEGANGKLTQPDVVTLLDAMQRKIDEEFKRRGK